MIPTFPAGSEVLRLKDAAKETGTSVSTLSRLVNSSAAWRRCAIAGLTGSRTWGINVSAAVAAGLARYSTAARPAFTARDLVDQVKADPALRRELAAALLGVAP